MQKAHNARSIKICQFFDKLKITFGALACGFVLPVYLLAFTDKYDERIFTRMNSAMQMQMATVFECFVTIRTDFHQCEFFDAYSSG